jgi:putative thioredoxin
MSSFLLLARRAAPPMRVAMTRTMKFSTNPNLTNTNSNHSNNFQQNQQQQQQNSTPTTVEVPRHQQQKAAKSRDKQGSANSASKPGSTTNGGAAAPLPLVGLTASATNLKQIVDASADVATLLVATATNVPASLQLLSALEQTAVGASWAKEKIRVVRFDVNQDPRMTQALSIQSVPTVLAMVGGRTVDAFEHVPPPNELEAFLKRLASAVRGTGSAAAQDDAVVEQLAQITELLDNVRDAAAAKQLIAGLMQMKMSEEQQFTAVALLLRCSIALGEMDEARQLDEALHGKERIYPTVSRARKTFELVSLPDIVDADSAALATMYNSVLAQWKSGEHEPAAQAALALVARDKKWHDGAAKKLALLVLDTLSTEQALPLRRKLQNLLFN